MYRGSEMELKFKKVLVTGAAGFIGFHLCRRLIDQGVKVTGIDNLNPYYDVGLKTDRLEIIQSAPNFTFVELDIADRSGMQALFESNPFDVVVNLAAQAGVRYSLQNPHAYVDSNLVGFVNILEGCRHNDVKHLVFASSSSVYGANTKMPFSVHHNVDHPVSLYAATKKANELMAHTYSHLYGLCCTGLRFFTVYGPWGRPDMAYFKFVQAILEDRPLDIYNHGEMYRDFTYVEDLARGIRLLMDTVPVRPATRDDIQQGDSLSPVAPYRVVNIGNSEKVRLLDFIEAIETALGKNARRNYMEMQPGDVPATWADADLLHRLTGYRPQTDFREGIEQFVDWYRDYYTAAAK